MDETPKSHPRRRWVNVPWWATLLTFAALAAGLVAVWHYGNLPTNDVRVEEVKADVDRRLPVGSTREEVRAWLDGRGITDSGDLRNGGGQVDGIWATFPNDTWFEPADIHFQFRFDKEWKLTSVAVYRARRR